MTHRIPSVLAAEVVTVDHLSGGRVECAVGAAWNEAEHRELGIPFPSVRDRMDRLEEGVQVMKLLFTQDDVTFEGRQVRLEHATYRPRPVQTPHPPIWIGGTGRTRTLPMVGRYADAWHGGADDAEELGSQMGIIDAAARGGRPRPVGDPAGLEPVDQRAVGRGEAAATSGWRPAGSAIWSSTGRARAGVASRSSSTR